MTTFISQSNTPMYNQTINGIAEAAQAPLRKRIAELERQQQDAASLKADVVRLLRDFPGHLDSRTWEQWVWRKNQLLSRLEGVADQTTDAHSPFVEELEECAAILLALQVVAIQKFGEGNKIAADIQKRIDAIDRLTGGGS